MADEPPPSAPAPLAEPASQPAGPRPFSGARQHWRFCIGFVILSFAFLALQVWFQTLRDPLPALVRGAGLSGATFVTLALLSSVVFKFHPAWARFWHVRRSLGVMGVVFALIHILSAVNVLYAGDAAFLFSAANPFRTPILFGLAAFTILFLLFISSNDWMVAKLGARWKALHRLVYFAYIALVVHYLSLSTSLWTPPGLFLIALTILTLAGQLFWFLRMRARLGWNGRGAFVGYLLIVLWLALLYFGLVAPWLAGR